MDTSPFASTPTPPRIPDSEDLKKYIRTFEGDMDVVRRGGTPDFTPVEAVSEPKIVAVPPPVKEVPVPPSPPIAAPLSPPPPPRPVPPPPPPAPIIVPPPVFVAPPPPIPEPPLPPPPIRPEPLPEPVPEPLPPVPIQVPGMNASPLQTYEGDFLDRVKGTNASTATILATEEDAGTVKEEAPKTPRWKTVLSIVGGVVLLALGGVGVYLGYSKYLIKTAPVVLAPTLPAPIFVDESKRLSSGSSDALLSEIEQSISLPPGLSSIRLLYADLATTSGNDIFSRLQFPAPPVLLRNINSAESMAGVVNMAGTASPFFILSVTSYPDTFAGMLAWESTMPRDVSALFPSFPPIVAAIPVAPPVVATATPATTTTIVVKGKTSKKPVPKVATSTLPIVPPPPPKPVPSFHDEVVSNHDVRVYRDSEGRSVFMYGYWNKSTLVIARDVVAFTEILRRLSTSLSQ